MDQQRIAYYNFGMRALQVSEAYHELTEVAMVQYKRSSDFLRFMCDVQDYMISIAGGARKPAALYLLKRRAARQRCLAEFLSLVDAFTEVVTLHRFYASESTDAKVRKGRFSQ